MLVVCADIIIIKCFLSVVGMDKIEYHSVIKIFVKKDLILKEIFNEKMHWVNVHLHMQPKKKFAAEF